MAKKLVGIISRNEERVAVGAGGGSPDHYVDGGQVKMRAL